MTSLIIDIIFSYKYDSYYRFSFGNVVNNNLDDKLTEIIDKLIQNYNIFYNTNYSLNMRIEFKNFSYQARHKCYEYNSPLGLISMFVEQSDDKLKEIKNTLVELPVELCEIIESYRKF